MKGQWSTRQWLNTSTFLCPDLLSKCYDLVRWITNCKMYWFHLHNKAKPVPLVAVKVYEPSLWLIVFTVKLIGHSHSFSFDYQTYKLASSTSSEHNASKQKCFFWYWFILYWKNIKTIVICKTIDIIIWCFTFVFDVS